MPAFRRWSRGIHGEQVPERYRAATARVDQALLAASFFWPEFVGVDGLILNTDHLPDDRKGYVSDLRAQGWTDSQIEYVVNHVHLLDVFLDDPDRDAIGSEAYLALARALAEMWAARLAQAYPGTRFRVGVSDPEESPEIEVYAYVVRDDQ